MDNKQESISTESATVSIIIPLYNVAPYLRETLDCLTSQTITNWEAILVDDGSTDDSAAIAEAYEGRDPRFRLVLQQNSGPSQARNTGLFNSNPATKYITFLDADDLWTSDALELMVAAAESAPEVIGAHAMGRHVDEHGQPINPGKLEEICSRRPTLQHGRLIPSSVDQPTTFASLSVANCMPTGTLLFKRDVLPSLEPFRNDLRYAEDWYVWVLVSLRGDFAFVDKVIFSYRQHSSNSSRFAKKMVTGYLDALDALLQNSSLNRQRRRLLIASQPAAILFLMTLRQLRRLHLIRAIHFGSQFIVNFWRFKLAPKLFHSNIL